MKRTKLLKGNNIDLLKKIPDNSIDSVVTDPPYGLKFMNKKWDHEVPSVDFWREVYRVLKPGGHVLSFGGTRTYHRMAVNIEDAGFEIRDQIMWLYGSGFPKSHNIGKAIDATIKTGKSNPKSINQSEMTKADGEVVEVLQPNNGILGDKKMVTKTVGASLETKEAQEYEGWGTALKPANEPICLARKPISEKSVADNMLKWRTGGINIDVCRVATNDKLDYSNMKRTPNKIYGGGKGCNTNINPASEEGRFPANIILDEVGAELLDEQSGIVNQGHWPKGSTKGFGEFGGGSNHYEGVGPKDKIKSGASRFFYIPKVSKKERNMGLDGFDEKKKEFETTTRTNKETADKYGCERKGTAKNTHPTVKPVSLMTYLCRLITPEGGIVLDPYMGSGSTGIAAQLEGFRFVGMEMDEDYFKIAESRIENFEDYREFIQKKK